MRLIGMVDTSEGHGMRERDDLLRSLHHKGLISKEASLDDILSLSAEDILNRRLKHKSTTRVSLARSSKHVNS